MQWLASISQPLWSLLPICLCPIDLCHYTKGSAPLINVLDHAKAITRSTTLSTHVHTSANYRSVVFYALVHTHKETLVVL